jgi:hypothetical protein
VPLTDAIFTSPVVADGRIYAVDGSGVAFAIDAKRSRCSGRPRRAAAPGTATTSRRRPSSATTPLRDDGGLLLRPRPRDGKIVREIDCGDPIFSTPVAGNDRAYFVTLGSKPYAVERREGDLDWDFVREVLKFEGKRWDGAGLDEAPEEPRDLEGPIRDVARHLDARKIARHSRGRAERSSSKDAGAAPKLALVGGDPGARRTESIPPRSGSRSARTARSTCSGIAGTTGGRVETLRSRTASW